ncbi:hypothetical protein ACFO1B_42670 [Dactylosporangium siamense]|uniref:Uncharacterized protein n=1 Tax=Dactylosporangium siamense TaxID=685454 RepID=A0A919UGC1_9ACTN|nr:hypothetical protein [Dactylosporangium siamense]GIG51131.1 hypothetical protein Dsi01nite_091720 [Dactylosporangium siamense]
MQRAESRDVQAFWNRSWRQMRLRWVELAKRPSSEWREGIAEEARLVASGALEQDFAVTAKLFPPDLLQRFDDVFDAFERNVSELTVKSDTNVLAVIQAVVSMLNMLNDEYDSDAIATGERDVLCEYIDRTISESGVDLDALSARHGLVRDDLTDEWRTW